MRQQDLVQLFDRWAGHYDSSVREDDGFPFDGYEQVLGQVTSLAGARPGMTVLDLGIGTGNLAARFVQQGCSVWGVDFSPEMLARAREKLPQAVLVQSDLLGDWPAELDRPFDRVVSAYVFHEFDLATKVELLDRLFRHHLVRGGHIVIGDIAYPTVQAREGAMEELGMGDDEEFYWAADEAIQACTRVGLRVTYEQVSSCGGVFSIGG